MFEKNSKQINKKEYQKIKTHLETKNFNLHHK